MALVLMTVFLMSFFFQFFRKSIRYILTQFWTSCDDDTTQSESEDDTTDSDGQNSLSTQLPFTTHCGRLCMFFLARSFDLL